MNNKIPIAVLILLSIVVLMGQVYPEGAPSFAATVNIIFLVANLLFLLMHIRRRAAIQ